ncbi:hypothetical protein Taro_051021 [Colocasia esculenta]|uniref:Retrotransposon gag domain-containing protein n=1 Tax=Colocasia esculenta TaxID=4460 RepID=A0A843XFQ0_COLES|nr:hypothetical protein [Colocasia esculenta]
MVFHGASDAAKCRAFPTTLKETARAWFETLPAGSIISFRQLKKSFRDNFLGGRTLGVQQPATLVELLSITQRHAACEESLAASRAEQGEQSDKKRPSENGSDRDRKKGRRNGDSPRRPRPFTNYTPLTVAPEQILEEIRNEAYVRWPQRMRSDPRKRDQNKYCRFHRDHGHDTSECRQLKDEIEDLIKRGYLGRFVRRNEERPRRRERTSEPPINNEPNGQEINVIAGGFGAGGESTRSRHDYARRVHIVDRPSAPRSAPYPTSPARAPPEEAITFSDEDLVGVTTPHTDALVISATINHCNVRRILVDNGSAPDVLAYDCFILMGLKADQLTPVNSPLFGLSGVSVQPMGRVRLPITLGTAPKIVTKIVDFLVINNMPGYNAILSRGGTLVTPSKDEVPDPERSRRSAWMSARISPLLHPFFERQATAHGSGPPTSDQPSTSRGVPAENLIPVQVPWTTVIKSKIQEGHGARSLRSLFGSASIFTRRRHPPRLELREAHTIQTGVVSATAALPNSCLKGLSGAPNPREPLPKILPSVKAHSVAAGPILLQIFLIFRPGLIFGDGTDPRICYHLASPREPYASLRGPRRKPSAPHRDTSVSGPEQPEPSEYPAIWTPRLQVPPGRRRSSRLPLGPPGGNLPLVSPESARREDPSISPIGRDEKQWGSPATPWVRFPCDEVSPPTLPLRGLRKPSSVILP